MLSMVPPVTNFRHFPIDIFSCVTTIPPSALNTARRVCVHYAVVVVFRRLCVNGQICASSKLSEKNKSPLRGPHSPLLCALPRPKRSSEIRNTYGIDQCRQRPLPFSGRGRTTPYSWSCENGQVEVIFSAFARHVYIFRSRIHGSANGSLHRLNSFHPAALSRGGLTGARDCGSGSVWEEVMQPGFGS